MIAVDKKIYDDTLQFIRLLNYNRTEFSQEDGEAVVKALNEFVKIIVPIMEKHGWLFRVTDKKDPTYEKLGFYAFIEPVKKELKFSMQAIVENGENFSYIDTFDWSEEE